MTEKREPARLVSGKRYRLAAPLFAAGLLLFLVACGGTTPPGPNSIGGSVEGQASYLLLDWQEGLRIMIWDDVAYAGHYSGSSSSTTDPLLYLDGSVRDADGRGYAYTLETGDGVQANFAIDGVPYDLNQGTLFLIRAAGDETQIQQLDVDLSGVSPTNEGIVAFGRQIPEIAALMTIAPTPTTAVPTPTATASPAPVTGAETSEAAVATATATMSPTLVITADAPEATTPPPQPTHSSTAGLTGIAELDNLATVILGNDMAARRELVRYTTAGCTTVDGLGGPPKCEPDQAEGTPVEYLPLLGPGEGVTVLPEAVSEVLDFPAVALYAAYRRVDEPVRDIYYPPGEYGLFFTAGEGERNLQFILVHANSDGHIVRLDHLVCPVDEAGNVIGPGAQNCKPEQIMEREAAEVLLAPPS